MSVSPAQQNVYYQNNPFGTSNYVAPTDNYDPMSMLSLYQQLDQQVSLSRPNSSESIFAPSGQSYVTSVNPEDFINPQNPEAVPPEQADTKDDLGILGGAGRIIAAPFKGAWEVVKSCGKFVGNVFSGAWRATGGAIGTLLSGHPIDALGEVVGGLWDVVKSPFILLWDVGSDCVNFVGDVIGGVGNIIGGAVDAVGDFFKGIFS